MAAVSGKNGLVTYKSLTVAHVRSWSADINTDMIDVTGLTTSTGVQWRSFVPGLSGGNFTINCLWDPSSSASQAQMSMIDNMLAGTTAAVKLEADKSAGGAFTGSCFLNRASVSLDIEGTVDFACDGTFTGAVTFSTTT